MKAPTKMNSAPLTDAHEKSPVEDSYVRMMSHDEEICILVLNKDLVAGISESRGDARLWRYKFLDLIDQSTN